MEIPVTVEKRLYFDHTVKIIKELESVFHINTKDKTGRGYAFGDWIRDNKSLSYRLEELEFYDLLSGDGKEKGRVSLESPELKAKKEEVRKNPNDAYAHASLGLTYQKLGQHKNAIRSFKKAIRIKPDHTVTHYDLGRSYQKLGQHKNAIASYKEVLRLNPDHYSAKNNIKDIKESRNLDVQKNDPINQDDVWAAEQLEKGLVRASVNGRVTHGDHIRVVLNRNACHEGQLYFTFYTTENNKNIFNIKGKIIELEYNQEKRKSKIIRVDKFLIGHIVMFDLGYGSLEFLVDQHKNLKNLSAKLIDTPGFKASDYFDVRENEWSLTNFKSSLIDAKSLCEKNKPDETRIPSESPELKAEKEEVRKNPNDAYAHASLGATYQKMGFHKKAIASHKEAIRIDPNVFRAYVSLGFNYEVLGQHWEAISFYKKAVRIKPDRKSAHEGLGRNYEKLGQYQEAIASYKEVLRLNSDHQSSKESIKRIQWEYYLNAEGECSQGGNCEGPDAQLQKGLDRASKGDFENAHHIWRIMARECQRNKITCANAWRKGKKAYAKAQYNLAVTYYKGQGVSKDIKASAKFMKLSAEQGLSQAQSKMAFMYKNGKGVLKDIKEAIKWRKLAAE